MLRNFKESVLNTCYEDVFRNIFNETITTIMLTPKHLVKICSESLKIPVAKVI